MNIATAVLGLLLGGPLSGYDLKKLFAATPGLHWSGNNNQIYPALVQLHRAGLAAKQTVPSAVGPARSLYTITEQGRQALLAQTLSRPDPTEFRAPILVRLAAADLLSWEELDRLLSAYDQALCLQILALDELARRGSGPSFGSDRQRRVWQAIHAHRATLYRAERDWLEALRSELSKTHVEEGAP